MTRRGCFSLTGICAKWTSASLFAVLILASLFFAPLTFADNANEFLNDYNPTKTYEIKPKLYPSIPTGNSPTIKQRNPDGSIVGSPYADTPNSQLTAEQVAAKYGLTHAPTQSGLSWWTILATGTTNIARGAAQAMAGAVSGAVSGIGRVFSGLGSLYANGAQYTKQTAQAGKSSARATIVGGAKGATAKGIGTKAQNGVSVSRTGDGASCGKSTRRSIYEAMPGFIRWLVDKTTGAPLDTVTCSVAQKGTQPSTDTPKLGDRPEAKTTPTPAKPTKLSTPRVPWTNGAYPTLSEEQKKEANKTGYNAYGLYRDSTRDTFDGISELQVPDYLKFSSVGYGNTSFDETKLPDDIKDVINWYPYNWGVNNVQCVEFVAIMYKIYGINMRGRLDNGGVIGARRADIFTVQLATSSKIPPKVGDLLESDGHVAIVSKVERRKDTDGKSYFLVSCLEANTPSATCQYKFKLNDTSTFDIANATDHYDKIPIAWMTKKSDAEIRNPHH